MKKEDYLREMESAGQDLSISIQRFVTAANPVSLLRGSVSRGWQWWLPSAAVTGFTGAKLLRSVFRGKKKTKEVATVSGAAFWIPTLLKLMPAALVQIVPLILSLCSSRKP